MTDGSTLPPRSLTADGPGEEAVTTTALVVLWCRDQPDRMGEVLLLPRTGARGPWVFGRGGVTPGDGRLGLVRQRPGENEPTAPLACPRISREQLHVVAPGSGPPVIVSRGRCALLHEGREVQEVAPAPGELLELRNELLFLCVRRPMCLPQAGTFARPDAQPFGEPDACGMLGESPAIWALRAELSAAARLATHVLVLGPSGSGKELVARGIHRLSSRGKRPLVARNAATIPEGLADAELFGNLRNYPNPGTPDRAGLVGEADGSSLFLDELAELSIALQARLLRVLDEGEYQRLGESTSRRTDLRLIAATNRPPDALKHDVLARFKTRLLAPGLDERREDIPLLAAHLLRRHAAADPELGARFFPEGDTALPPRLSPRLTGALVRHTYTTHVRELDALLLKSALESRGKYLDLTAGVAAALTGRTAGPESSGRARRAASAPGLAGAKSAAARPAAAPAEGGLTPEERRCLELLRKHGFSATGAGRDPEYPGNRQTADLHLRKLMCRALKLSGWSVQGAIDMLAGDCDASAKTRLAGRIETFLQNLRARAEQAAADGGGDPEGALARSLADEWRGSMGLVLEVIAALQKGSLSGLA